MQSMYWMPAPYMVFAGADIGGAYHASTLPTKGMAVPIYQSVEFHSPCRDSQRSGKVFESLHANKRRRRPRPSVWATPVAKIAVDEIARVHDAPNLDDIEIVADLFLVQLAAGGEAQRKAVARAHQLTVGDQSSSRVMQLALKSAASKDAFALVRGLHGHVREAILSMHGNYVVQKIIELMPASISSFILDELRGAGAEFSRHRFGCRIICRLLEHVPPNGDQICAFVDEILSDAGLLCRHHYGNYVMQHILEFGVEEQKSKVVLALCASMQGSARNRNSSHTLEKALEFCSVDDRFTILQELLQDGNNLHSLAQHPFGCYVVRALFSKKPDELSKRAALLLHPYVEQLTSSKYGRRVVEELCN